MTTLGTWAITDRQSFLVVIADEFHMLIQPQSLFETLSGAKIFIRIKLFEPEILKMKPGPT
jgi:hypothetical protein